MKNSLPISGRVFEIEYQVDNLDNTFKQVVVRCDSVSGVHLTYHKEEGDKPKRTHVSLDKRQDDEKYKFISTTEHDVLSTAWLSFPIRSTDKLALDDLNRGYNYFCARFWITPSDKIIGDNDEVNKMPSDNKIKHTCINWTTEIKEIYKTKNLILEVEIFRSCCFAIKGSKIDATKFDVDSITRTIGFINENGKYEQRRFIPLDLEKRRGN